MDLLNAKNIKFVLRGRVKSVIKYQSLTKKREDILRIQIIGFSNLGIRNYFESSFLCETLRNDLAEFVISSLAAKVLLSVPFYRKAVCSTLSFCYGTYSLKTMTELQTLIFFYLIQQTNKTTKPFYQLMQKNKRHILNVGKVAFNMLDEARVMLSKAETASVVDDNGFN